MKLKVQDLFLLIPGGIQMNRYDEQSGIVSKWGT